MNKEYLKEFTKEDIYNVYRALNVRIKNYDKITRNKMLEVIESEYEDYHNIISICTLKELTFLKKLVTKKKIKIQNINELQDFILSNLSSKLLIKLTSDEVTLMDGLENSIKEAITKLDLKTKQHEEDLIIPLLGAMRLLGLERYDNMVMIFSSIYEISSEEYNKLLLDSLLFKYYTFITYHKTYDYLLVYHPYMDFTDELISLYETKKMGIKVIDDEMFINVFYYGYDKNNKEVSTFMEKLKSPILQELVTHYVLFDDDRSSLKELLNSFGLSTAKLDEVMDKMPSSKYQLLTKEEYAKDILKHNKFEEERDYAYQKQVNASLHPKDCDLFYKLYFALLEYTNQEYKINETLKIYKSKYLNPTDLYPVINKFFENKDSIVDRVVKENPYKFSKIELEYLKDFKRTIRGNFFIYKYDLEYTLFSNNNTIYMVKGLRCPIDEIIDYKDLPYPVETSLIPFKGYIVYDGILGAIRINLGTNMKMNLLKEAEEFPKVYKL